MPQGISLAYEGTGKACHGGLSLRGVAGRPCKDRSGRKDLKPKRPLCKIQEILKPKDYLSTSTARALAERDWLWHLSEQGFWHLFLFKQQQSLWIINNAFSWGQNAQNWLQRKEKGQMQYYRLTNVSWEVLELEVGFQMIHLELALDWL